jgi:hypothetical protein
MSPRVSRYGGEIEREIAVRGSRSDRPGLRVRFPCGQCAAHTAGVSPQTRDLNAGACGRRPCEAHPKPAGHPECLRLRRTFCVA